MKDTLLVFVWLSCMFFLTGCIARHPKDIAVISIHVVDYREQAEFAGTHLKGSLESSDPYRDFLIALSETKGKKPISPSDIDVYFQQQNSNESFKNAKPQKPIFKLEFTSKENLHEFSRDKGYPVSSTPYFCNRPDAPVRLGGGSYIYWRGLRVDTPFDFAAMDQNDDGKFVYYTFLFVDFTAKVPSSYESFDLRAKPEDICIQLRGGFAGRGFASNVVVIPKAAIINALEQMPSILNP